MTLKRIVSILLVIGLFASCSQTEDHIDSYIGFGIEKKVVDRHLENQMEQLNIPGMSIAFINNGKIVHHKTFGYANLNDSIKVTQQTIFEAASLSKPVFAYFVMKYVEEGKIDLDVPLYRYLPYPDIAHDDRYKKITARMVLSHRTGFPNWRSDGPENKLFIQFEPGTDYSYSGEGYQYLAKVLKHIEQTDWEGLEKAFQSKVAIPLGMEHTVFIQDDYSKRHKAEPYDENGEWIGPERDVDSLFRYQFRAPASIHSEPLDFSKWLIALMENQGLEQRSFDELYNVHSYVDEFDGVKVDYTLGFFKPRLPLTNIYLHGGNNYGFTSFFTLDPHKKWGFVLFTNSEYGEQLGNELAFYLLTGPDLTKLYVIIGLIILSIIFGIYFGIKFILKKRKKRRYNRGYNV
ncbi:MAG: serine hydrolase domain-containing protein [Bacteroidota bacterium]